MSLVIDASVATKWVMREADSAAAEQLYDERQPLIAPDLVVAEVCNAAWKRFARGEMNAVLADGIAERIAHHFDALIPLQGLAPSAMVIARALGHSVYDCFYLALAEREAAVLVTVDRRLLARVQDTPWKARVTSLAEYASKIAR